MTEQWPAYYAHIRDTAVKCKSTKWDKNGISWMHMVLYTEKTDGSNIFHAIMVLQTLQPYILYESHNASGHNGSIRLYNFIKRHYYWKLYQHCNKYVRSCPECQQVTFKHIISYVLHQYGYIRSTLRKCMETSMFCYVHVE